MAKQLTIRLPEEILPFIEAQKGARGWKTDQAAVVNLLWMAVRAMTEPDGTDKTDGVVPSDELTRHYQARLARLSQAEAGLIQPAIHQVLVRRPFESEAESEVNLPVTRGEFVQLAERVAKLEKANPLTHVPWPPRGLTPAEFEAMGQIEEMHRASAAATPRDPGV